MIRNLFKIISGSFTLAGQVAETVNLGLESINRNLEEFNADLRKKQLCEFYGKDASNITSEEFYLLCILQKRLKTWLNKNKADDLFIYFHHETKVKICSLHKKNPYDISDAEYIKIARQHKKNFSDNISDAMVHTAKSLDSASAALRRQCDELLLMTDEEAAAAKARAKAKIAKASKAKVADELSDAY